MISEYRSSEKLYAIVSEWVVGFYVRINILQDFQTFIFVDSEISSDRLLD